MGTRNNTRLLGSVALVAAIVIVLVAANITSASAREPVAGQSALQLLNADYAIAQMNMCMQTAPGALPPTFDRTTLQLIGEAETLSFVSNGISSFDGAGNWSATGDGSVLYHGRISPGDSPVLPHSPYECEGSYSVAQDRTFSIDGVCRITEPPFAEFSPFRIEGRISVDRQTLIFHEMAPGVQEVSIPGVGVVAERICTAIATDVRALKRP